MHRTSPRKAALSRPQWFQCAVLLALVVIAYLPVWSTGFIWDDDDYVTRNVTLRTAEGLRQIWFVPRSIPQYYPLVHTTFWIEHHLWGVHPLGYHLTNVLLHGLSAVLLWRLLARLEVRGAYFAAAIFAVHPVMVESVAWITERKNVLSLALALGAMLSYLRYEPADVDAKRRRPSPLRRDYALAFALFVAALLSKSVVFSMPMVLLVIYWWKRGTLSWSLVRPLLPFFAAGIAAGAATAWLEKHHVGAAGAEWSLSPVERVLVAGRAITFYAGKLAWPHPLIFFYPRWQVSDVVWWQYLYPAGVLAVLAALWTARHRIGRGPLAAALIFAGLLSPALGFFDVYPFRYSYVADHFQYHASIALIALAAAAAVALAENPRWRLSRVARFALAGGLLLVLGVLTLRQVPIYENLETLYRDVLARNPSSWNAYVNLSNHFSAVGRQEEALAVMREGLAARPDIADVQLHYGSHLLLDAQKKGQASAHLEEVLRHYRQAVRIRPELSEANFNLATALQLSGQAEEAARYFARTLEIAPNDNEAKLGLGSAHFAIANKLMGEKQFEKAADHYRKSVRAWPQSAQVHNHLGIALMNLGQREQAIQSFQNALRVDPHDRAAQDYLRRAREEMDQR